MSSKNKFSGPLAEPFEPIPIRKPHPKYMGNEWELYAVLSRKRTEEKAAKLPLLMDHYGIDRTDDHAFALLSFYLAIDFVDGFKEKEMPSTTRGRPKKWDYFKLADLYFDVIRLREQQSDVKTVKQACKILSEQEKWQSFIEQNEGYFTDPDPTETLRQAYSRFPKAREQFLKERQEEKEVIENLKQMHGLD